MNLLNLTLSYGAAIHTSHSFNNSQAIRLPSTSSGGREIFFNSVRLSSFSTVYGEGETSLKNFPRAFSCLSPFLETLDNDSLEREEIKVNKGKRSLSNVHGMTHNTQMPFEEKIPTVSMKFQSFRAIHFRLLIENLDTLEETFVDSEVLKLKNDIILQLGRVGALELFNACHSRCHETSIILESKGHPDQVVEHRKNSKIDDYIDKVVVQSSRKKQNRSIRKRVFSAVEALPKSFPLNSEQENLPCFPPSVKRKSKCKNRRIIVARREIEMSKAVKVLAELEKIKAAIEEDTKQVASLSSWAEASGMNEKVLKKNLHYGQYCRDELIRSTRSLVLFLARKYRGLGIAMEDLLQAGYVGVLQGAERFDCTRGYRFSTYVQYWIRKSMSSLVTRFARGILIPWSLRRAMNQIHKAQKFLKSTSMRSPDDHEIAKMTGLSLDKIRSASNCMRVVASINHKVGDCLSVKHMELMPDMSVGSTEEAVMKEHMRKDLYDLLKGLDSRERRILTLRFGLSDHQPKSLEEIGRHFKITKEWVRKIEKNALTKLRNKAAESNLKLYLGLDL